MKHFLMIGAICGCLFVGSFYPKIILNHHVRLVDETGKTVELPEEYSDEVPVEVRFWFFRFFR